MTLHASKGDFSQQPTALRLPPPASRKAAALDLDALGDELVDEEALLTADDLKKPSAAGKSKLNYWLCLEKRLLPLLFLEEQHVLLQGIGIQN